MEEKGICTLFGFRNRWPKTFNEQGEILLTLKKTAAMDPLLFSQNATNSAEE